MCPVVRIDSFHRIGDFLYRSKRQESLFSAVIFSEAGVLRDHRAAGGKIAGAAVAEPAGREPHIVILGDRELALGMADEVAVGPGIARNVDRVDEVPGRCRRHPFASAGASCQRPSPARSARRCVPAARRTHPLDALRQLYTLSSEMRVAALLVPAANRRVRRPGLRRQRRPQLAGDRLPRRLPVKTFRRNRARRGADVFADGESA